MFRSLLLCLALPITCLTGLSKPPINEDAKAIARVFPKASFKGGKLEQASGQIQKVFVQLGRTNRNSRSSLQAVMSKATDFRNDIGHAEKRTTMAAILDAWETAEAYGALNDKYHFSGKATRGRYAGTKLVWEHIIPPDLAPEFAGYVGNVRLVPEERARKKDEPLSPRDLAYLNELQRIQRESLARTEMVRIEKPREKLDSVGLTAAEAERRYREEVEAAGPEGKAEPAIRLRAQRLSTPSRMNGNRYRVVYTVINASSHPTEIDVELQIIGYTDNDNILYLMANQKKTLQLRRSEVREIEVWTPNVSRFVGPLKKFDPKKSTKVYYRGYIARAYFKGKVVSAIGSDGRLHPIATGENAVTIPKLY